MNKPFEPYKMLVWDIETVPLFKSIEEYPEHAQKIIKAKELKYEDLALYSSFSKIACISVGRIDKEDQKLKISGNCSTNEIEILDWFGEILKKYKDYILTGHNIKGFDIPFTAFRYLANKMNIPKSINFEGLKPWEIEVYDTFVEGQFGVFGKLHARKLDEIMYVFNLPSPKEVMDGSQVKDYYYDVFGMGEMGLTMIEDYCNGDIISSTNAALVLKGIFDQDFSIEKGNVEFV